MGLTYSVKRWPQRTCPPRRELSVNFDGADKLAKLHDFAGLAKDFVPDAPRPSRRVPYTATAAQCRAWFAALQEVDAMRTPGVPRFLRDAWLDFLAVASCHGGYTSR